MHALVIDNRINEISFTLLSMLWCLIVATPTLNNKMADDMKLYVHSGDEYSSSIDPESLQVLVS